MNTLTLPQALSKAMIAMVATSENLVDKVWSNRPPRPLNPTMTHPLQYSGMCSNYMMSHDVAHGLGKSWVDKIKQVHDAMEEEEAIAVVVTALDEVACMVIVW